MDQGAPGSATVSGSNYRFVRARFEVGGDVLESADATLTMATTTAQADTVILPVPEETWAQHFENNGFTTIQNFINAGYTYWLEPSISGSDGTAEWITDCGEVITSIDVALKFDVTQYDATDEVTLSYEVDTRRNETDSWTTVVPRTNLSAGSGVKTATATLSDFRYIRTVLYGKGKRLQRMPLRK